MIGPPRLMATKFEIGSAFWSRSESLTVAKQAESNLCMSKLASVRLCRLFSGSTLFFAHRSLCSRLAATVSALSDS